MPKRKQDPSVGLVHQRLARTLVRARAERALEDDEELERQAALFVQESGYATMGKKQSDAGKTSPGRRGKYKVSPETLRDEVKLTHQRLPRLTFNDVCHRVAKKFGYKSAWPVKNAAATIKWLDPR